jgi:calcium/calmodulin-dependent 3',5'-cyclic nucleotide phosphodiesterase
MVIAALGHDVGHTGKNNNFHINSQSEYAITYHDKSVLENFHIYVIFKILKKEENNILTPLKKEEFTIFRKRVIEAILATDMSFHSKVLTNIKNKLFNWNELKKTNEEELFINPTSKTFFDEQQEVINLLIHAADIAHNTKPFVMSEKWTELLTEEFHLQGDKEKELGLPISFLCDRTTSNVPKSQIGFISFVIIPTFQLVTEAFPSLEYLLNIAKKNLSEWEIMHKANEEKKEKEEENKPK